MTKSTSCACVLALSTAVLIPGPALAQVNTVAAGDEPWTMRIARVHQHALAVAQQQGQVPQDKQVEAAVQGAVKKFHMGVEGGVGLDPELIMF